MIDRPPGRPLGDGIVRPTVSATGADRLRHRRRRPLPRAAAALAIRVLHLFLLCY
ncbi:hypothetical protein M9500_12375 [Xanthomonas oryzae pv. oryzae]|nr:hypothetical protein M9500_12375 [Xanthomonas oryzae pv. oryzae]